MKKETICWISVSGLFLEAIIGTIIVGYPKEKLMRGDCVRVEDGMDEGLYGTVQSNNYPEDFTFVEFRKPKYHFAFFKDRSSIKRVPLDFCYEVKDHE